MVLSVELPTGSPFDLKLHLQSAAAILLPPLKLQFISIYGSSKLTAIVGYRR